MNATALYVSTCRYILQADFENSESWGDLYRLLPYLRQSLSCCVCGSLLDNPQGPTDSNCQHFVCRTCIGGKMLLKPSCSWCKNYRNFSEVRQLKILLSCYKKLCEYIAATPIARSFVGANGESNSTQTILQEGMAINVIHESSNTNPDKAISVLDILSKINHHGNAANALGTGMKKPGRGRGRPRGRRPQESTADGTGTSPRVKRHSDSSNPEAASPVRDSHLDGLCNGVDTSDHLDMSDYSFYSASMSNSDTPRIKIKRKRHSNNDKNKLKKIKRKKKRDKEKLRKLRLKGKQESNSDSRRKRLMMGLKRRRKISKDSLSDGTKDHTDSHDIDSERERLTNGHASSSELDTPKKRTLVISGHRAKLLKAGRSLPDNSVCRCGTWNKYPGANTCRGIRCPCFMSEKGCVKCKCRGCRNPFQCQEPDSKKSKTRKSLKSDMNGESDVDVDVTNI